MKHTKLAQRISLSMQLPGVRGVVTTRLINLVGTLGFYGEAAFNLSFSIAEALERMTDPAETAKEVRKLLSSNDDETLARLEGVIAKLLGNRAEIIGHQVQTRMPKKALQKGSKVLDFGAGDGKATSVIARKLGMEITGIDLADHNGEGVVVYDGNTLPFCAEEFNVVFAVCSLHHTSDVASRLDELYRVTKVGGHIVVIETLADSLDAEFGADIGVILDYVACWCLSERQIGIPGHYHGYHQWPRILRDHGFDLVETLEDTGYPNPGDLGVDQPLIQIPHGIFIAERRPNPAAN
jgi:SAM-dependent methyltransferase